MSARCCVGLLIAVMLPSSALSQAIEPTTGATSSDADIVHEKTPLPSPAERSWRQGQPRWFIASLVDVGFLFLRTRLQLGHGRPHHQWIGIEANPILSISRVGGYVGGRVVFPQGDFRIGARHQIGFRRGFLEPKESFDHIDLATRGDKTSSYLSLEAQLTGEIPLGPGKIRLELTGTMVRGVPEGEWVFEDTIRVVAAPPWIWSIEGGYVWGVGPQDVIKLGPVAELVGIPGRDALIVRAGIKVNVNLSRELQLRGTFMPVLESPDTLGLKGADGFLVGLRYRWASR